MTQLTQWLNKRCLHLLCSKIYVPIPSQPLPASFGRDPKDVPFCMYKIFMPGEVNDPKGVNVKPIVD